LLNKINVLSIDTDYVRSPQAFNNLIKYFLKYVSDIQIKNFVFSQSHANIFYILEPLLKEKKLIDLVTIDEHHDISYFDNEANESFCSSNWLGYYLKKQNFIDNIYWLTNHDSMKQKIHADKLYVAYEFEDIFFEKFDFIFVCNSPFYSNVISELCFQTLINIVTHNKKCQKKDFFKPNLLNHNIKEIYA
tara:strand:- start:1207 stop:1776 length:570 start_codon:yes stop_codon:yes gene_type:complete